MRCSSRTVVLAVALPCLLGGCHEPGSAAARAADAFAGDVAGSHWRAACSTLAASTLSELESSQGKACPAALPGQHLPDAAGAARTRQFGRMAQVRVVRDTLFLTRSRTGWKVLAAGCTRQGDRPYSCVLQGG